MTDYDSTSFNVPAAAALGVLEDIVLNQMSPGDWYTPQWPATWPGGSAAYFVVPSGTENIIHWTHVGFYDATRRKAYLLGCGYGYARLCVYDLDSDQWSVGGDFNGHTGYGGGVNAHIWDSMSFNEVTNIMYYGEQLAVDLSTMQHIAVNAGGAVADGQMGSEYFPEVNAVIYSDRNGNVTQRPIGGSLTSFGTWSPGGGGYHSYMTYNPIRGVMYFGGGNGSTTNFYEIGSGGGAATNLGPATGYGIDCTRQHAFCGHISGDLIVCDNANSRVFRYKHGTGWANVTMNNAFPTNLVGSGAVTALIPLRITGAEAFLSLHGPGTAGYSHIFRYS